MQFSLVFKCDVNVAENWQRPRSKREVRRPARLVVESDVWGEASATRNVTWPAPPTCSHSAISPYTRTTSTHSPPDRLLCFLTHFLCFPVYDHLFASPLDKFVSSPSACLGFKFCLFSTLSKLDLFFILLGLVSELCFWVQTCFFHWAFTITLGSTLK